MAGQQKIIMNYSYPPSMDDLEDMASALLETLPEELMEFCAELTIQVEDIADEATESEQDLDDAFDLLALYKSGKQISPGVESKAAAEDDVLILYRRPLLDMWCEASEDLAQLLRQTMIEEIGQTFDFSDEEIDELCQRHYQGML
jgi:predicted Zn-dependent protease with MMP-like domain